MRRDGLEIDTGNGTPVKLAISIIQLAPYLHSVDFNSVPSCNDNIDVPIKTLSNVCHLALESIEPESQSLYHLLLHHVQLGSQSLLKVLDDWHRLRHMAFSLGARFMN